MSDSGIWCRSDLYPLFNPISSGDKLDIPRSSVLIDNEDTVQENGAKIQYLIGEDGFGLCQNLMKPYPDRGLAPSTYYHGQGRL